jgi:hypothetical protein
MVSRYELFQWTLADLDEAAGVMAEQTANSLLPHVTMMCDDWVHGSHAEEARLESIRQRLVDEIERVRSDRVQRRQRKEVELEPEG